MADWLVFLCNSTTVVKWTVTNDTNSECYNHENSQNFKWFLFKYKILCIATGFSIWANFHPFPISLPENTSLFSWIECLIINTFLKNKLATRKRKKISLLFSYFCIVYMGFIFISKIIWNFGALFWGSLAESLFICLILFTFLSQISFLLQIINVIYCSQMHLFLSPHGCCKPMEYTCKPCKSHLRVDLFV